MNASWIAFFDLFFTEEVTEEVTVKTTYQKSLRRVPAHTDATSFLFDGITSNGGTIVRVCANYVMDGPGGDGQIRIQDVTNQNTICGVTGLSSQPNITAVDLGVISNMPDNMAVFELQFGVGSGTTPSRSHTTSENLEKS